MNMEPLILIIHPQQVGKGDVYLSVCKQNVFQALKCQPFQSQHSMHIHGMKMFLIEFKVKGQTHQTTKQQYGFRVLKHYPFHVESPYHAYRLPLKRRCSLSILGSNGQMSSALDIKVTIWFLGFQRCTFHIESSYHTCIQTTHGSKMISIEFGVKRSSSLDIKVAVWFSFKIFEWLTTPFVRLK